MTGRDVWRVMPSTETLRAAYATIVLILIVVACAGSPGASPSGSAPGPIDATGTWRLESGSLDGPPIPLIDDWPVTLVVDGSSVSGTAACNGYGAEFVVQDGVVRLGELSSTAMACDPPQVMDVEAAYTSALQRVDAAAMDGDALVLSGPGVSLRFLPVAPPAVSDILDTSWHLDALTETNMASSVAGDPATLELRSDGSFSGSTGCRSFTGRWVEAGAEIQATELAMDQTECPPELAAQDSHVVSVLGDGFTIDLSINGKALTLTAPGGIGLQYSAALD